MSTARGSSMRSAARALIAGIALSSASASAQPPPGESMAVAEALFQQARDLFKQGQYDAACPKFAESQRLDPKLGTLLNLAVCHEKLGKIATAWAEYTSAAAIARREGRKEREDFARDQVAALEKKLARVILQVGAPEADLRITWDDQPLAGAVLSTPFPVDPGKHRLAATAPGKKAWSKVIEVPSERTELLVPIPALEAAAEPQAPPPPPAVTAPPPPVPVPSVVPAPLVPAPLPVPPPPARNDATILMGTGFGVGAAGVLFGALTGAITLAKASSLHTACGTGNHCPLERQSELGLANTLANVSNVSFALGAVGAGVGIVGVVLRPRDAAPRTGVTVTPIVGPGIAGLRGSF